MKPFKPFQESFVVNLQVGIANGGEFKTVPPRKRAVIEHVSVHASAAAAKTAEFFITSAIGDGTAFRDVPIVTTLGGNPGSLSVLGSHRVLAFANPGTEYGPVIRRLDATQQLIASFVLA